MRDHGKGHGGAEMDGRRWLDGEHDRSAVELREALGDARRRTPDDVTLRRMWGRIASTPAGAAGEAGPTGRWRAPRWLWFAGGVASSAAAALALAAWLMPRPSAPPPARVPGVANVATQSAPAPARPAPAATVMVPGRVHTAAGESLHVTLPGGAEARLGSSSAIRLDAEERPVVEGGEISFHVPHQPPGRVFVVMAGPYRVVVVGTTFLLGIDDKRRVNVAVQEGRVEIWNGTRLALLGPGEGWSSPEGADKPGARAAHERADLRSRARRADVAPAPAAVAPPGDSAADARAALTGGDVQRALAVYRALAERGGPAGENAEYEVGKILRDRMGRPASAIATWRHYRSQHPGGLLRVEADVSIIETLVHTGELEAALAEADDFLRQHPASERRAEIARVAGDLYRSRGDCARAVAAYETALAAPQAGGVREAASFHRASCLVKLGDPSGAPAAQAYLRTWPAGRFRDQAAELVAAGRAGP